MTVVRGVVFPALRLVVWAVIAVALAVLAFRGGTGDTAQPGPGAPPVDLASPVVTVGRGTVANTVTVQGTVVADATVPVRATKAGTVRRLLVEPGDVVAQGEALLEIRWEEEREPVAGTDADPTTTPPPPRVRTTTVPAPSAGTVAAVDVLVEQVVAVGDRVGGISPGTLSVTAPLTQDDQFRLLSPPSSAQVEVEGGPAPFPCGGLTLGAPPATGNDPAGDPSGAPADPAAPAGGQGGTTARCQVPAGTTVFAGMAATVVIEAGLAEDVLVVPVTAVQGSVQQGNVWVVGPDGGEPTERAVSLGLTDGDQVEVREGLAEGDQVLLFVPVPDDTVEEPAYGGPVG